jgi:hypothetical protein
MYQEFIIPAYAFTALTLAALCLWAKITYTSVKTALKTLDPHNPKKTDQHQPLS